MKCKNCKAKLEKGMEVCPSCGESVPQPGEKRKIRPWQIVLICLAGLLLLTCLSVVVYWGVIGVESFDEGVKSIKELFTPRENDVYYKDSYSVSDEKAADKREKVVATVGDAELTNGVLQLYYWMNVYDFLDNYGYYAVYAGLDYTEPLDEQTCLDEDCTWQQFFLDDALAGWHNYQAMALMAQEAGMSLTEAMQSDLDNLRTSMTEAALSNGFSSIDAMIQSDMGPGCTYEDYYAYMEVYYKGYMYFSQKYDAIEVTNEMLEAYFTANEETLAQSGITKESGDYYDVRHILIGVEGGTEDEDGNVTYSDDEWEACRAEAQALLDEWLAGEHTEETFAELAAEYSEDTGSNTNGGLYENLTVDYGFVEEFENWYTDESRQAGDYGLVRSSYGYHIMYFSGAEEQWIEECRGGIMSEEAAKIVTEATSKYPISVNYKNIVLGVVDLSSDS